MPTAQDIKRGFFAQIPSVVLSDKRLTPTAKLIYGELFSLSDENGQSYPSNGHFAEILGISEQTAKVSIARLKKCGLLDYKVEGFNKRVITIFLDNLSENTRGVVQKRTRGGTNMYQGVVQKRTHSNALENTQEINNIDVGTSIEDIKIPQEITKNVGQKPDKNADKNHTLEEEIENLESSEHIRTEYQFRGLEIWENLKAPPEKKGSFIKVVRDENEGLVNEAYHFARNFPVTDAKWKVFFKHLSNAKIKLKEGYAKPL